jgi:hypothetical protein
MPLLVFDSKGTRYTNAKPQIKTMRLRSARPG